MLFGEVSRARYWLIAASSFFVLIAGWQIGSWYADSKVFLPSPMAVVASLGDLYATGLTGDILASVWRVTLGFAAALIVSIPVGIMSGCSKIAEAATQPINDFFRYLPVAAFIPLSILWVGISDVQKSLIIFLGTVFQMIPLVADTVARTPKQLIELGFTMGMSRIGVVKRVVIPWSTPAIYDHARVALGWAWSYLIVAELVAANSGLGHVIIQAQRFLKTSEVMAGILVIGIVGLVFDQAIRKPRRMLFPWI